METLVVVLAFLVFAYILGEVSESLEATSQGRKFKEVCTITLTYLLAIPFCGFLIGWIVSGRLGWQSSWKGGLFTAFLGFGIPLSVLYIVVASS